MLLVETVHEIDRQGASMKQRFKFIVKVLLGIAVYLLAVLASAAVVRAGEPQGHHDTLWQVSTIDALLAGVYDAAVPVGDVLSHGNVGLGTFEALDGEMVVLDGAAWRVRADGKAYSVAAQEMTPFAQVTPFEADFRVTLDGVGSLAELTVALGRVLPSPNMFYAIRAHGDFAFVKTRSVPRQSKPYPPLREVAATQPVFELTKTDGDIVGFYGPAFAKGTGVPGFHLHYLSAARDAGGHMLDIRFAGPVTFELDTTTAVTVALPDNAAFAAVNLTPDREAELKKVEK